MMEEVEVELEEVAVGMKKETKLGFRVHGIG